MMKQRSQRLCPSEDRQRPAPRVPLCKVCNSMTPNVAWGIYDDEATQKWLAQNDTLHEALGARDLLIDGRAGLRVGNVRSLVGGQW